MNQTQHDDLAALFAQRMNFAPNQQTQQPTAMDQAPQQQLEEKHESPIHYVSTHYTHTGHIRTDTLSESSGSPPPPYHEIAMPEAMAQTLRENSINPTSLLSNQIHLFGKADYDQRLRLLELWRVSPPSHPVEQHFSGHLEPTSLEQEEFEARKRYDIQTQAHEQQQQTYHMEFDTHIEPMSPIRDSTEPAWPPAARMRAASIAANISQSRSSYEAEPYMVNGYQSSEAPRSQALDPVYGASAGLWQAPSYARATGTTQDMKDQYGAYQQIRCHADWEAMNERAAREKFGMVYYSGSGGGGDVDMEL